MGTNQLACACAAGMLVVAAGASSQSQCEADPVDVSHDIVEARVRLRLPNWRVRPTAEARRRMSRGATGVARLDAWLRRSARIISRASELRQLTIEHPMEGPITPVITLWVHPTSSRVPTVRLLGEPLTQLADVPGFEVLQPPTPVEVPEVDDAAFTRFRIRAYRADGSFETGEKRTLQLRHRGHLVTLSMAGAASGLARCEAVFEAVRSSVAGY